MSKEIGAIRKRITKQLNRYAIFGSLSPEEEKILVATAEYAQYKRAQNERDCEIIKQALSEYIFNPNVVVKGAELRDGEIREVTLSKFEAMIKSIPLYLATINIQNKMWGLYERPPAPVQEAPRNVNIQNAQILAVQEMQQLAKEQSARLKDSESRTTNNGSSASDS
jgi:hypothetical protein